MKIKRPLKNINFNGRKFFAGIKDSYQILTLQERKQYIIILGFSFFGGAADIFSIISVYPLIGVLVQPEIINKNHFINQIWTSVGSPTTINFIVFLSASSVMMILIGGAISLMSQIAANKFAASCQERLGYDLMNAMLRSPYSWHLNANPLFLGSLFQNHIVIWSRDFLRRLAVVSGQLASVIIPSVILIIWSPLKGMLILVVGIIVITYFYGFTKIKTMQLMQAKKKAEADLHIFLVEVLQGIKDIKLSSAESDVLKNFRHSYHISSMNHSSANSLNLLPSQLIIVVGQISILGIGTGLFLWGVDGGLLASTMAIVVLIASRVLPAMNRVGSAVSGLVSIESWVEPLSKVLNSLEASAFYNKINHCYPRLEWRELNLSEVAYKYPTAEDYSINDVSLSLKNGGSYAFVGASGAGKSTLVDLILGLLHPSSGSINLDGKYLSEDEWRSWQQSIGFVPQMPVIIDATLRENVAFGVEPSKINDQRVVECLAMANFSEVLERLPDGLYSTLGDRGVRLSGGQRQRVAIARALYKSPDIIVLDEATSALDNVSENAIKEAFAHMKGSVTLIAIAHRLSTVESCDCIFLVERGHLVAKGSYDELLSECELFRSLSSG